MEPRDHEPSGSPTIRVGTTQRDYNAARNILMAPAKGIEHVRAGNVFRYPNHALFKAFNYIDPLLGNLHWGSRECDILHFYNMASVGGTPWVTTFETALPRWQGRRGGVRWGLSLFAGKACRRMIAMSDCAIRLQRAFLADHPDMADAIVPKLTVLHPPQAPLVEQAKAASQGRLRFAIVGADFFRKGGGEILRAFDQLLIEGAPIHLTIVSTMAIGDYATHATAEQLAEARRLIGRWPDAITHFERLPNPQVLDLFRRSDVALLPTWADTYGYSVLEAQAAGLPVLTTDIRALPEINSAETGWVIAVPKDALGSAAIGTQADREIFSQLLAEGIERALRGILADPASIQDKGARSLERIRTHHDPVAHGVRLREIYLEALG